MDQPRDRIYVNVDRNGKQQQAPPPRGPSKRQRAMRVLVVTFCTLVLALVGCGIIIYVNVSKIWGGLGFDKNAQMEVVDEEQDDVAGLPEVTFNEGDVSQIAKGNGETDILMIGVDNRNQEKFTGRSDVMMYLRVNTEKKTIKMVSFMRDTLVNIEGHGKGKLNAAYSFGSIDLAYETYKNSFGLTPDYYMVVNFYGMEDIIDALGGVDISIDKDELEWLNININEINKEDPSGKVKNITRSGDYHLNGRQAVAYMRIRHPGGDNGRIERQQTVMHALFSEMRNVSVGEIPGIISALTQYVRTDMPLGTMVDLASAVRGMGGSSDLESFRYPEKFKNGNYNGSSIVQPEDFATEFSKLMDFLAN
jgi:LCP family protein required for cell wall assembly